MIELKDILLAREPVYRHLRPTPLAASTWWRACPRPSARPVSTRPPPETMARASPLPPAPPASTPPSRSPNRPTRARSRPGRDFDEARLWAQQRAREKGGKFVGPTDEELIQGVGTYGLEILEALPDVDVIIVPVNRPRHRP